MPKSLLAVFALCLLAVLSLAVPAPEWPGPKADGFLLYNGWRLAPAGIQVPLPDTLPMAAVLDPSGKYLLVLSGGYTQPSVLILDPANPIREGGSLRVGLQNAWLGLAINKAGDRFYVPEANAGTVREFSLTETRPPTPPAAEGAAPKPAPPGVLNVKEERSFKLFEGVANANARGNARWVRTNFLGDAAIHPDGKRLYVTDLQANLVYEVSLEKSEAFKQAVVTRSPMPPDPQGALYDSWVEAGPGIRRIRVGVHPYRILIPGDGSRIYVSNWGAATISVIEAASGKLLATWATGDHPSDMLADSHDRLFVACANTNAVYVHDLSDGRVREQILVSIHPKSPPGSTPNALAISPDESRLYVANADNNAVAVVALGGAASRVEGFIPVGWYPTALRVSPDGRRLFVANGKGLRSYPNPLGPQPTVPTTAKTEYVARIQKGSLSIIDVPDEKQLKILTTRVLGTSPYRDQLLEKVPVSGPVVPARVGDPSPIKYVMYIIKENRTYDQVLGDMKEGNGDPNLVLFPEDVTPNHHRLAREFVLLDNFYVNSDVSADGHNWSTGALANDFVQKLWPANYGGRRAVSGFEGQDPTSRPPGGYIWDVAARANITYRSYGEYVENGKTPEEPVRARVKALEGHFCPMYRSFDTTYSDQKRVDEWLKEFREFEKNGDLPRLQILRLPNDHTTGTSAGAWTPRAMVADNDLALGRIVEAVSRSRYWPEMAIFVLEDDAQNGPDHVDSHRSPAFVISPWVKRASVDSTMYSTAAMLRTIELILGLPPMTQYDAGATPMFAAFGDKPDPRPYALLTPKADLNERNAPAAPGAAESARLDFSDVDRLDADEEDALNLILWRAMKGNVPMPPPTRSAFPALAGRR